MVNATRGQEPARKRPDLACKSRPWPLNPRLRQRHRASLAAAPLEEGQAFLGSRPYAGATDLRQEKLSQLERAAGELLKQAQTPSATVESRSKWASFSSLADASPGKARPAWASGRAGKRLRIEFGLPNWGLAVKSPPPAAPFVYRLGLKIFNLARGVRLP